MAAPKPVLRGSTYHLRMRVPVRYAAIERRREIHVSLRTDSYSEAVNRAATVWRDTIASLDSRLAGVAGPECSENARARTGRILALAAANGWTYYPAGELAKLPLQQVVERLAAVEKEYRRTGNPDIIVAGAGGIDAPTLMLSELAQMHERASEARLTGKTADQLRKWRNPLLRAQEDLIMVVGDKPVRSLTADDARNMKAHYRGLVAAERILDDTANKRLGFIRSMVRSSYAETGGNDPAVFSGYRIDGTMRGVASRPEFSDDWIRDTLYCPDPLPGLNEEARDIVLILEATGCRPSEISGLAPSSTHLDAAIPHYAIELVGRNLKNRQSVRDVPLVGQALEAARRHPNGFPRYRGKDTLSAVVNKYLREHGHMPTDRHVLYSLRHSFEGRMKRAGVDLADRAAMMGHSRQARTGRERYGDDPTLAEKVDILRRLGIPGA